MNARKVLVFAALTVSLSSFAYKIKVTNLGVGLPGADDWAVLIPIPQATGAQDKIGAILPWGATVELDLPNSAASQPLYFLKSSSYIPGRSALIQTFLSKGSASLQSGYLSLFNVTDGSIIKVPGVAADRDLVVISDDYFNKADARHAVVDRSQLINRIKAWLKAKAPEYYNPNHPSYATFSSTIFMNRFNNYLKMRGLAPIPNK